jgi:hypothetical protein
LLGIEDIALEPALHLLAVLADGPGDGADVAAVLVQELDHLVPVAQLFLRQRVSRDQALLVVVAITDEVETPVPLFSAENHGLFWDLCAGGLEQGLEAALSTIEAACAGLDPVH